MSKFLNELKRRNVIKSTIAYLVVAWVLLQVFTLLLPIIGAPEWIVQGITLVLAIGLPIWIIVSWVYDITPQGLEKTGDVSKNDLSSQATNKRLNAFIIASLSIAVVVMGLKISGVFSSNSNDEFAIAVLPFVNMSNDEEQEYFSDGISEEIINMLAQVPRLTVMGRTSSFAFKGKNMDLKLIGEALNVAYLLEGSVRRSGNTLRITAQLIDVADGSHLYSEKFDREVDDIFDIQDEISQNILSAVKIKLLGEEKEAVFKKYTDNVDAYQLYLKGKFYYSKYTKEDFLKAIDYFNQAIAIDPDYAIAYAGISYCYHTLSFYNWLPAKQAMPLALEAGKKSIELDDQIAESLINLARKKLHYDWNVRDARIQLNKAKAINPNNPEVYIQLAFCAVHSGDHQEVMVNVNKAIELDPFSTMNLWMASASTILINESEKTLEISEQLIDLNPNFFGGHLYAGQTYMRLGKFEEALQELKIAVRLQNIPYTLSSLGLFYGIMGDTAKAREIIEDIKKMEGIEELESNSFIGDVYLSIGEWDTAFEYYDKAIENREGNMLFKKVLSNTVPGLTEDPRAEKMFEKMNIIY